MHERGWEPWWGKVSSRSQRQDRSAEKDALREEGRKARNHRAGEGGRNRGLLFSLGRDAWESPLVKD